MHKETVVNSIINLLVIDCTLFLLVFRMVVLYCWPLDQTWMGVVAYTSLYWFRRRATP